MGYDHSLRMYCSYDLREMMEKIIEVEHLYKKYHLYTQKVDRLIEILDPTHKKRHNDFYALQDISFDVKRGETVGIIGTNGSGKSTLLKILTGVVAPTKGDIKLSGKISALLELGAGFNPEYTGIENIYLNGTMMGYSRKEMDERKEAIIDFADIGDFINQPVKNYSSGMFARLAFAVAINVEPDILIVDEALSVGDVFFQNKCFRKFDDLRKKGVTILFVSHDIESVKQMCQRVLWIERGRQQMFGPSKEVCNSYATSILGRNNLVAKTDDKIEKRYVVGNLELTDFPGIQSYGNESILSKEVVIRAFYFEDEYGQACYTLKGGEKYRVAIVFECKQEMNNVLVGFVLQNKKGQILINTNTLVTGEKGVFSVRANSLNRVEFELIFPYLSSNEYILDCAVAQGTNVNDSKMLTWLYGALRIFVENPLGNLGMLDVEAKVSVYSK